MLLLAVLYANGGGVHMSRGSPRVSPIVVSQARNATKNGFAIYRICLCVSWGWIIVGGSVQADLAILLYLGKQLSQLIFT